MIQQLMFSSIEEPAANSFFHEQENLAFSQLEVSRTHTLIQYSRLELDANCREIAGWTRAEVSRTNSVASSVILWLFERI